jgi:heme oxygenase
MTDITQQELRLIVQDLHSEAETTQLAQDLIAGTIDAAIYKNMCYQMWLITDAIEYQVQNLDQQLTRRHQFIQDIVECPNSQVRTCPATHQYVHYINNLYYPWTSGQLKGAMYTFYLGWLYGGQMIAKKLTLPKHHLEFTNVKWCVDYMRNQILVNLTDRDGDEARRAFETTIKIYRELYELH